MSNDTARVQRGIQSIEVGGQLLHALVHNARPMALKDLAREAGMVPAKAHPYLVSFARIGLIEQDVGAAATSSARSRCSSGSSACSKRTPCRSRRR